MRTNCPGGTTNACRLKAGLRALGRPSLGLGRRWGVGIPRPLKFGHWRRLIGAGHGGELEDDGPQFFLGNPPFAAEDRQQPQAAKQGLREGAWFLPQKASILPSFYPSPVVCGSSAMSPDDLTARLKAEARRLGFDLAGATAAVAPPRIGAFQQWLADGFAGADGIHPPPGGGLRAPQARFGRRAQPAHAGHGLSHGGARRACPRPGPHRPLCLGDRLSRRGPRATARPGRLSSRVDARRRRSAAWSTRPRSWNASSPSWPAWAGSARTPCS